MCPGLVIHKVRHAYDRVWGKHSIRLIILASSPDFILPVFAEILRLGATPDYRIISGPEEVVTVVRARSHDLAVALWQSYYPAAEAALVVRESGPGLRFAAFFNYGRAVLLAIATAKEFSTVSASAHLVMQLDERLRSLPHELTLGERGTQSAALQRGPEFATVKPQISAAHNFSELLTVILGSGEILLERLRYDESALRHLEQLLAAAKRAGLLITEMAASAVHTDDGEVDVGYVLARSRGLFHKIAGAGLLLTLRIDSRPMTAQVSHRWLESITSEIVAHARLFLPDGSRIDISLEPIDYDVGEAPLPSMQSGRYTRIQFKYSPRDLRIQDLAGMSTLVLATRRIAAELGLSSVYDSVKESPGTLVFERGTSGTDAVMIFLPRIDSLQV